MTHQRIETELIGIAEVLTRNRLRVPPNQREFSWEEEHVTDLLSDLNSALRKGNESYFLGTIVLTRSAENILEVADGQQRLATITMIIAAMRNLWEKAEDKDRVYTVESKYLFNLDIRTKETTPRLTLNLDDNEYFHNVVLKKEKERNPKIRPTRRSHHLISGALDCINSYLKNMEKHYAKDFLGGGLVDWLEYLNNRASVVMFCVPSSSNAFVMFETLNDRGLRTSQADLVKNYLFDKAGDRRQEAQQLWSNMRGAVESMTDEDLIMDFLRLVCCLLYGHTRVRDVMDRIQNNVTNKTEALVMLRLFSDLSHDYAAILNQDHPKWSGYNSSVKKAINTLNIIGVTQIRPMLLAIARCFKPSHAAKVFRWGVSWSVRFLIQRERGGKLDEGYARLANLIFKEEVNSPDSLKQASKGFCPTDAQFKSQFKEARVGKAPLARYYLRSLEQTAISEKYPEFVPNDDIVVTLEHIMPKQLHESNWPNTTEQDIETHCNRIGNLCLLTVDKNTKLGNESFEEKKRVYSQSSFTLTKNLADFKGWGIDDIEKRQTMLADLAVKTWKID